jgi:hypothetical protein
VDRTTDWASEKNIAKSMRWARKLRERILASQNGQGNKNMEGFFDG